MRINTNLAALNAWRALTINHGAMTKSLEKLSSGYRVNRAADDAAGLAVSEKMRAQIRGLNMAVRNAQDGVSLIQTAEGGAQKIQDMLQRMRELAVQAASDTLDDPDRQLLNKEFAQLIEEIERTANSTTFNEKELLNADAASATFDIHVGPGADPDNDVITLQMADLTDTGLKISELTISTKSDATTAISTLDNAIDTVSSTRATFGAYQNRLEGAIETLKIQAENLTAAESRIRDADMALEMATFTKYQILQQASTAMLAQANMSTQSILSLLR
ncbi:flagellin [Symbiobacterium thermophilum]|uniref:Flagellin n=1 Tax=Symbiobacterium thermophilum (strain DSM 24528 / JCM 14929 / IAM 14863 / T) TaxID=292459 RepID=Q67K41_SYMTH|nr:flagellin [Symbiobacterium thermophilum]BAD41957.1 flagellin [Symbiobacterium thermophilum IAM 14863]